MSLEERNTKLIQLLIERKELVQESKRIQENLGFCFTSRTFSKFDKQDKSSGNTNESLTTTFASLSEEMKILAERLTYCSEEMENLSKGLDSKSIEMFYEEESKKEDALYKFALLKEATTDLRLIDHLKTCTSIKYNTTPELFLTDLMKKELKDKVPSASERDMEFAVEDYVGRLRLHYMAELQYRYALFLQSRGFIALNVDIRNDESVRQALEIIKNNEFEKENFKELPFYSLRRGIQLLQSYQSSPAYTIEERSRICDSEEIPVDKWIDYQNFVKYEWELAKKSIEDDLCQITKLIVRARQAGCEINFDGDPLEEVLKMERFGEII